MMEFFFSVSVLLAMGLIVGLIVLTVNKVMSLFDEMECDDDH